MPESFSISRATFSDSSPDVLQQEIQSRTGNESATRGILRSMERFGSDESIRFFEMIPQQRVRTRYNAPEAAWTVRAVR